MILELNRPSLALGSVKYLECLIKYNDSFIEYGSGRSTLWLEKRCKTIISVESNRRWFSFIKNKLKNKNNILLKTNCLSYINSPFQKVKNPKIVLIDGLYRKKCFAYAWNKLKSGSWVVLDDANREEYRSWLAKYPPPTKCFEDLFGVFCTHFYLKP